MTRPVEATATGRVADLVAVLAEAYPPAGAEDWDVVGLTVGTGDEPAGAALLAVEVTAAVVAEAVAAHVDVIVAHHPLLLRSITRADGRQPGSDVLLDLVRADLSLVVAHTNADVAPGGVVDALADVVGLTERRPLRPHPAEALDKLVTFVPPDHLSALVDALAAAGGGHIGAYERCYFAAPGVGSFRPLDGARPFLGAVGAVEEVVESRLEMVLPRRRRADVLAALLAAHPYETPAYDLLPLAEVPSTDTGLGRVGDLAEPLPLADLAARVAAALPATGGGLRVAGDPRRRVRRVAVQAGAGDDLLAEALSSGADVYLTSDLRHHPALGALTRPGAPSLIDVSHWAAEWTWLPVLQRLLRDRLPALRTVVSAVRTDPWDWHVASPAPVGDGRSLASGGG